jgi:hypothetical protein
MAVRARGVWPTLLPTVNPADEKEVLASARRGVRSLIVRELLSGDDDVPATSVAAITDAVFVRGPVLAVYPISAGFDRVAGGWAVVYYRSSDQHWLSDTTTSGGIHYLVPAPIETCLENTRTLLERIYRGEYQHASQSDEQVDGWVCVSGPPRIEGRLAVVKGQVLRFCAADQEVVEREELAIENIEKELRRLVG